MCMTPILLGGARRNPRRTGYHRRSRRIDHAPRPWTPEPHAHAHRRGGGAHHGRGRHRRLRPGQAQGGAPARRGRHPGAAGKRRDRGRAARLPQRSTRPTSSASASANCAASRWTAMHALDQLQALPDRARCSRAPRDAMPTSTCSCSPTSSKEVEMFLLNRNIAYETGASAPLRGDRAARGHAAVARLGRHAASTLSVFASNDERAALKTSPAGRPIERAGVTRGRSAAGGRMRRPLIWAAAALLAAGALACRSLGRRRATPVQPPRRAPRAGLTRPALHGPRRRGRHARPTGAAR